MNKARCFIIIVFLLSVVGCARHNGENVEETRGDSETPAVNETTNNSGTTTITTVTGLYELVANQKTDELYVYALPGKDVKYGPIKYEYSTPVTAFTLEDSDKIYLLTDAGMSSGDLLEVSLAGNAVKRLDHCVELIGYSADGAWVAYNRMYDRSHGVNPGENLDAYKVYLAAGEINESDPFPYNPPIGSYVYTQYTGKTEPLFTVTASGSLTEPGKPAGYYGPGKLIDGNRATAWAEGADGLGVGEWVEFTAAVPLSIHGIGVWGGLAESPAAMRGNAHPIKMSVILDGDNEAGYVEFGKAGTATKFSDYYGEWRAGATDDATARAETVRLTIVEAAPGTKWEDCCISEIEVW